MRRPSSSLTEGGLLQEHTENAKISAPVRLNMFLHQVLNSSRADWDRWRFESKAPSWCGCWQPEDQCGCLWVQGLEGLKHWGYQGSRWVKGFKGRGCYTQGETWNHKEEQRCAFCHVALGFRMYLWVTVLLQMLLNLTPTPTDFSDALWNQPSVFLFVFFSLQVLVFADSSDQKLETDATSPPLHCCII